MHHIRAVIFDFDGLLVDSEPVQVEAWRQYLRRFGKELHADLLARMYGRRLVDASLEVVRALELPVTAAEVAEQRDAVFLTMVPGAIRAKPGAAGAITELTARNVPIALATSGHRRYVDLALESAGLPRTFRAEVTGEMVERGKPAPDTFLLAAERLGVPVEVCLVVEDSPNGVRAALNAGMVCIAIPDDRSAAPPNGASLVLESLAELVPTLDRYSWTLSSGSQG